MGGPWTESWNSERSSPIEIAAKATDVSSTDCWRDWVSSATEMAVGPVVVTVLATVWVVGVMLRLAGALATLVSSLLGILIGIMASKVL